MVVFGKDTDFRSVHGVAANAAPKSSMARLLIILGASSVRKRYHKSGSAARSHDPRTRVIRGA
jgi:hypothetical protein